MRISGFSYIILPMSSVWFKSGLCCLKLILFNCCCNVYFLLMFKKAYYETLNEDWGTWLWLRELVSCIYWEATKWTFSEFSPYLGLEVYTLGERKILEILMPKKFKIELIRMIKGLRTTISAKDAKRNVIRAVNRS